MEDFLSDSPFIIHGAPGEAGAEGGDDQVVAAVEALAEVPHHQRDGGAGGVAEFLDVDQDLAVVQPHTVARGGEDPQICLMRNQIGDVLGLQ